MEDLLQGLEQEVLGNELWRYVFLLGALLVGALVGKLCGLIAVRASNRATFRTREIFQAALQGLGRMAGLLGFVIGLSIGLSFLELDESVAEIVATSEGILATVVMGVLAWRLIRVPHVWMTKSARDGDYKMGKMLIPVVQGTLQLLVIFLVVLQIIQIISDQEITSIIAGLGLGGLAFALAAQDSLKNVFGSILIFLDKPFQVGERIVYEGHDGVVEEVGLRSTRIRLLTGHLVIAPNSDVANKAIVNIGKRPHIRRLTNITITYDTPPAKVEEALKITRELLENHEGMHEDFPPRCYFSEFNAASLNLLVIYWYHPPNYWDYMAFSEKWNLQLLHRFNEAGIKFAFPTQTLYLQSSDERGFPVDLRKHTE